MIEESVAMFETFCKYVDYSSLAADQHLAQQYLSVVQTYAHFASNEFLQDPKIARQPPLSFRWRTASLKTIRSVVGSEAVLTDSQKQLEAIIPVILDNLYLEEDDILAALQQKAQTSEKLDLENARKRRMSVATVTTVDTNDADPATASGTTADADKLARDEVRVLAVRCLKQIFAAGTASHRGQIRLATVLTLRFIASRNPPQMQKPPTQFRPSMPGGRESNWATSLMEAIARWTPVQDRFIIVLTAMETLVRSPVVEAVLDRQLVLATMIDWLLSSSVNLIGLSVMDVLLGLVQHTLQLLQLGGRDSLGPAHRGTALDLFKDTKETFDPGEPFLTSDRGREPDLRETTPSPIRQELLQRLQKCIGNLATHIYYTDQITDMMTAILARLRPNPQSEISTSGAIDDPSTAAKIIAAAVKVHEDPTTDGFFSFATARVIALRAIKDILIISNYRRKSSASNVESRSRVGIQVWEGTQWLLRDEDREVRVAYVDAFLTWLRDETNSNDQHIPKEGTRKQKAAKKAGQDDENITLAKRAVSNASRRETKPVKSTFLQLLHLAVYDNAVESPESEANILLMYILVANLVEKLGVNALRTGLPMMLQLQETALNSETIDSPERKVNLASLVQGYLWTIGEKFNFEATKVGTEISAEMSRRKRFGVWLHKIRFPPVSVEQISAATMEEKSAVITADAVGSMKPFLSIDELVEEITVSYDQSLATPAASPPTSPGRVFSVPTLGFGYGYNVAPAVKPSAEDQLPQKVKDEMKSSWSREACIASLESQSLKTTSISGSRTGMSTGPKHLSANGGVANGGISGQDSPIVGGPDGTFAGNAVYGAGGLGALHKLRRLSTNDGSPIPLTASSSRESMMRVTDLKQALLGYPSSVRHSSPLRRPSSKRSESFRSDGSDSMMMYDGNEEQEPATESRGQARPVTSDGAGDPGRLPAISESRGRDDAGNSRSPSREMLDLRLGDDVPPVPRIPSSLNLPGTYPPDSPVRSTAEQSSDLSPSEIGKAVEHPPPLMVNLNPDEGSPGSIREGRTMKRGNSRPTSRRGLAHATSEANLASKTSKVDVGKLLAGIHVASSTSRADLSTTGSEDIKIRVPSVHTMSKPPY